MAEETKKKSGFKQKIAKFFKDYKSEFKKIVWPAWSDTLRQSGVVIAAIIVCGAVVFLLDTGFSTLLDKLGTLL